jgi:hypothetical protein
MRKEPLEPKLSIELVPKTCWWSNVRSNISPSDWEKCKKLVRERSGDRCEICGGSGPKWPVECHELWDYDDEKKIQTLVGLIALCPSCHEVKHIGLAEVKGRWDEAIKHLMLVNGWNKEQANVYIEYSFELWAHRSTYQWQLNIDFLSLLDIEHPLISDRERNEVVGDNETLKPSELNPPRKLKIQ